MTRTGLRRPAARAVSLDVTTPRRSAGGVRLGRDAQYRDGVASIKKNDSKPWIVKTWCVPPAADAEYVWRMADVLQTYLRAYDPRYPVVRFDEAGKQVFGDCLLYTSPSPRDGLLSRMPSSA